MRKIKVNILRGCETGSGEYKTYAVEVEDGAVVSVMNILENIYENPNGETYKGEILDGQQILLDIPSLSADEGTDLFTFEFVSNYLVNATISFRLSPLINVEDESDIIPIKFSPEKLSASIR